MAIHRWRQKKKDTKASISFRINVAQSPQQHHQHLENQNQQPAQMGTKRNRVLTRQPRVKRDSDSLSNNQISPEPTTGNLDFEPFGTSQALYASAVHGLHHLTTQHHHHHHGHHHLLSVPPRIERHASEPAPSLSPHSPHLLSVPQTTPFLVKQHSDPLLPSQHSTHLVSGSGSGGNPTNPFAPLHRQYSHPLTGASGAYLATSAPLQHSQPISLPESIYETASPPPAGSSQYVVPQTNNQQPHTSSSFNSNSNNITSTSSASSTKSLRLQQFTMYGGNELSNSATVACSPPIPRVPAAAQLSERSASEDSTPSKPQAQSLSTNTSSSISSVSKFRNSKSVSAVMLTERTSAGNSGQSGSFEHLPNLRVRNEELQRSVSSPQTNREIFTLENPRSSHCPVIRPGPALGCNFCWNTIDGHGRILRRKTKYHCPECQTNLCIVPCFQEYHERLNNELETTATSTTTTTATTTTTTTSSSTRTITNSAVSSSTNASQSSNSNSNQLHDIRANNVTSSGTRHYAKTDT